MAKLFRLRYKRLYLVGLIPLGLLLTALSMISPAFTEKVYTQGIYHFFSQIFSHLTSIFPFSLAEILLILGVICTLCALVITIVKSIKRRSLQSFACFGATFVAVLSVLYFLFVLNCGINYSRLTFAQSSGLEVEPVSVEDLYDACSYYIGQAAQLREEVAENERGIFVLSDSVSETMQLAAESFQAVSEEFPVLAGNYAAPKPVLFSRVMSYLNITGIYSPFTFEANVNTDVPAMLLPATMCHEMAHVRGFMREDEANFIGFLAASHSDDPTVAYSGTMMAVLQLMNAMYASNRDLHAELLNQFSDGMRRDWVYQSEYWDQFEGPVAEVATAVNNTYLQANRQTEGVKSYGRMVDLVVAFYKKYI